MSGETEKSVSGWTVDTLRESMFHRLSSLETRLTDLVHAEGTLRLESEKRYNDRFTAVEASMTATMITQKEALTAALASAEKAVSKSEIEVKEWRTNANEWRGTISDRDQKLMSRAEGEQQLKAQADKIDALDKRMDRAEGRNTGLGDGWKYFLAAVGLILTLATLYNLYRHAV